MQANNYNRYIHGWLEKIEDNIIKFKQQTDVTPQDKIDFVTRQYELMYLIHRALHGQVIFVGAKPINNII